jgi:Leucine-rich repeat (LRR) protein
LTYLDASHNALHELGTALPPALTYLDVGRNTLTDLPDKQLGLCKR